MRAGPTSLLRCTDGLRETRSALSAALAGGGPVAPLPSSATERAAAAAMLRIDVPIDDPDIAAVVATSGSTGAPKGVLLSRAAIRAAVEATHDHLGGPADWVLALPVHYVAGLMVVARAVVAGTELTAVDDVARLPAAGNRSCTALVPTQLSRALQDPQLSQRLSGYAAVLLGGAAVLPGLLARARSRGINVVTTYGMSETCGGCVYDGAPLPGIEVELDEDGRISLGGPMIFSGYRLRPDLTREVLTGNRFHTSDRGQLAADGRLVIDGRIDDVIISGGLNVDLAAVEQAAREVSAVEVAVVGVPDPEWGTVVVAVVEGTASPDGLRSALAGRLPAYALPRRVVSRASIPRLSSGKIDRQRLLRELTETPEELPNP